MQYGFCLHDILSRNSMLHSGQGNGFPRKSCVLNVTLCRGLPFRAVSPCDPIHQATRRICAEQLRIRSLESNLILHHLLVLHLLGYCRRVPTFVWCMDVRIRRVQCCFPAPLRNGACQSRHPHYKMGWLLWSGNEIQL